MPEERQSIMSRAEAMKKAGFHPVMIVVITVLSTPGIWQQFFDDTDEKAMEAIEKAYPLLERQVEQHAEAVTQQRTINAKLYAEVKTLRTLLMVEMGAPMLALDDDPLGGGVGFGMGGGGLGGGGGALMPPEALFPAAGDGDADDGLEGVSEPQSDAEGDIIEEPIPRPRAHARPRGKASDSLEDLIQQQQQAPIREKLPDLSELLGGRK